MQTQAGHDRRILPERRTQAGTRHLRTPGQLSNQPCSLVPLCTCASPDLEHATSPHLFTWEALVRQGLWSQTAWLLHSSHQWQLCDLGQVSLTTLRFSSLNCKTGMKEHLLKKVVSGTIFHMYKALTAVPAAGPAVCTWELQLLCYYYHCSYSLAVIPSCPSALNLDGVFRKCLLTLQAWPGGPLATPIMALVTLFTCLSPPLD